MSKSLIILIIVLAIVVALLIILYFLGKKQQKKQDEQQAQIDSMKQSVSMLIIDKKKMRLKDSGLPQQVIDDTPWYARRAKVPVVKAKVGPQIMLLIADNDIFDEIPVKKEVKASVAGIYITGVRNLHGKVEKPEKKRRLIDRIMGQK